MSEHRELIDSKFKPAAHAISDLFNCREIPDKKILGCLLTLQNIILSYIEILDGGESE